MKHGQDRRACLAKASGVCAIRPDYPPEKLDIKLVLEPDDASISPRCCFFSLFGVTAAVGYLTSAVLGLIGLARRRLLKSAFVLVLMPLHWLLLSLAAWRALYQLVRDPYRWEKTAHGLARTSRLAAEAASARETIFQK